MGEVSKNQRLPEEKRFLKPIKTGLRWLFIAALIAAGLLLVAFIVEIAAFAFYKPVPTTYSSTLGDLDGDGDLDAVVGNTGPEGDTVWLNDSTMKVIANLPDTNAIQVAPTAPVSAIFSFYVNAMTVSTATFTVRSELTGVYAAIAGSLHVISGKPALG